MDSIKITGCHKSIRRDRDGEGDSGTMFNCIDPKTGKTVVYDEIRVGHIVQCGASYGRSYSAQDWWMTTPVTEILGVSEESRKNGSKVQVIKFRTGNSLYTVRSY